MKSIELRDGQRLAYESVGNGEPLLLLMGTGAPHGFWAGQMDALSALYRVVAIDWRGTGASGDFAQIEDGSASILAGDAAELIEQLDLGPTHVLGVSLGGAVGQELALQRPELVRSLSVHGTWAYSDPWFVEMVEQMACAARHGGLRGFIRCVTTWILSPEMHAQQAAQLDVMKREYVQRSGTRVEGVLAHCHADCHIDQRARLPGLEVPTLVAVGERDIQVPPRYGHEVQRLIPNAKLHTFRGPRSSHCALLEMADEFTGVTRDFLATVG
ncbi:MAG: alpha/beta hydrolase [Myxococcales bacterium]|nr:alpha/beta hydrolase [Myxococcales bacterium]